MMLKISKEQITKKWILPDAQLRYEEKRNNILKRNKKIQKIMNRMSNLLTSVQPIIKPKLTKGQLFYLEFVYDDVTKNRVLKIEKIFKRIYENK